jgi:polyhydroxybutyrate depolymerase
MIRPTASPMIRQATSSNLSFVRSRWVGLLVAGLAASAACGGRTPAIGGSSVGEGGAAGPAAGGAGGDAAGAGGVAAAPSVTPPAAWNVVLPGAGCGKDLPADQPPTVPGSPKGYKHYTVMGTGANLTTTNVPAKAGPRTFWVRVPADYDPNHAYRVVYLGQGCGTVYQTANTSTYQLYKEVLGGTEQAIYVALDIPEDMANMDCYDNRDGLSSQEWEAFQLFQEVVDANYCTDLNRIFVAGYSTGGWLANMWGCYFAGWPTPPRKLAPNYHIRGQAAVTGSEPAMQPDCGGPVAAIWIHDAYDITNPLSDTIEALRRVGRMNGCDTTYDNASIQVPWHPEVPAIGNVCKRFTGCPADYPVVFCTTDSVARYAADSLAIPAFKLFFDEMNPAVTR